MMLKRSPIVSMVVTPAYSFNSRAAMVITIIETNEPGRAFNGERWNSRASIGHEAMSATLTIPTAALHGSMLPMLYMYAPHFSMKSAGTLSKCIPRRSFTCVVKIVMAIPLVNPTTIG